MPPSHSQYWGLGWTGDPPQRGKTAMLGLKSKVRCFLPFCFASWKGLEMVNGRNTNDQRVRTVSGPLHFHCFWPSLLNFERDFQVEKRLDLLEGWRSYKRKEARERVKNFVVLALTENRPFYSQDLDYSFENKMKLKGIIWFFGGKIPRSGHLAEVACSTKVWRPAAMVMMACMARGGPGHPLANAEVSSARERCGALGTSLSSAREGTTPGIFEISSERLGMVLSAWEWFWPLNPFFQVLQEARSQLAWGLF